MRHLPAKRILRTLAHWSVAIGLCVGLTRCGDVEKPSDTDPNSALITSVLRDRWQKGYMTEDVDLYMSAYWAEGFLYQSDMGTDNDPADDLIFDDVSQERDSAIRIFQKFEDIEIEISEPPELTPLNEEKTRYEVRNHYRIQFIVTEGTLEGGFTGAYAEGDNVFVFEKRLNPSTGKEEWRIVEWRDFAFDEEEIKRVNNL